MYNHLTLWQYAPRPNYTTNINRQYAYSETPFLAEYDLDKIPRCLNDLIDHVDYWGEGKVVSNKKVSGFPNCYNVNQEYQLVSNGSDKGRKIPNRIPVVSYNKCDTSAYIRDNSVAIVTVLGHAISNSCVTDIARIINNDFGKVIVFGSDDDLKDLEELANELRNKLIYMCSNYTLPTELKAITQYSTYVAFLSEKLIKDELMKLINNGIYSNAVELIKSMDDERSGKTIKDMIRQLLTTKTNGNFKLMSFAYTLWHDGGQDIVRNLFPEAFKFILDRENVKIVNYGFKQALKLDAYLDPDRDRLALAQKGDLITRACWHFRPVWINNEVTFKLYNVVCNMYLKLDVNGDGTGDRKAWGSSNSNEDRHRFYVEPYVHKNGALVFIIINCKYRQGLKLWYHFDNNGDRQLWGHNGDIYEGDDRHKWTIEACGDFTAP